MARGEGAKAQLGILGLNFVLSFLTGFAPGWTRDDFTLPDQIGLSVGLFAVGVLLDVVYLLSRGADKQVEEYNIWTLRSRADNLLNNIRAHFAEIAREAQGTNDLFVSHYQEKVEELHRAIKESAEKGELRVTTNFWMNADVVFNILDGEKKPTLRYTWPIEKGEALFNDMAWNKSFQVTGDLADEGKLEVQALLIVATWSVLQEPNVAALLDYYKNGKGQECRIILEKNYDQVCEGNEIPKNYLDFGIYGKHMLFRSEVYRPVYVGSYTKDASVIAKYTKFFDHIWRAAGTKKNPSKESRSMSAEDLINAEHARTVPIDGASDDDKATVKGSGEGVAPAR